jgi:hypothetical protein
LVLVAACSSASTEPGAPADATTADAAAEGDAALGHDAGRAPDSATTDASDAGPPLRGTHTIYFNESARTATLFQTSLGATFRGAGSPVSPSCRVSTIGPCAVALCTEPKAAAPAQELTGGLAGEITVRGPGVDANLSIQSQYPAPGYPTASVNRKQFAPGDLLSVTAPGGLGAPTVPAFTSPTVAAPSRIVMTMPTLPGDITLSRTAALPLAWTGGGAGSVEILVQTSTTQVDSQSIVCTFPAAAGTGLVPAAAMALLAKTIPYTPGTTPTLGTLSARPVNQVTFLAGAADQVTFRVTMDANVGLSSNVHVE